MEKENTEELCDQELRERAFTQRDDDTLIDKVIARGVGDIYTAVVLNKLVYYFTLDITENPRILYTVVDGEYWVAKFDDDWFNEYYITKKQVKKINKKLKDLGLIKTTVKIIDGQTATNYCLDLPKYVEFYKKASKIQS